MSDQYEMIDRVPYETREYQDALAKEMDKDPRYSGEFTDLLNLTDPAWRPQYPDYEHETFDEPTPEQLQHLNGPEVD